MFLEWDIEFIIYYSTWLTAPFTISLSNSYEAFLTSALLMSASSMTALQWQICGNIKFHLMISRKECLYVYQSFLSFNFINIICWPTRKLSRIFSDSSLSFSISSLNSSSSRWAMSHFCSAVNFKCLNENSTHTLQIGKNPQISPKLEFKSKYLPWGVSLWYFWSHLP